MAQHLLDAVPRHLRFNRGGGTTRNLLLCNISKGELPLRICSLKAPFSLQIGSLSGCATDCPGLASTSDHCTQVLHRFSQVNIDCSPPLQIELVIASETTTDDELQSCLAAARANVANVPSAPVLQACVASAVGPEPGTVPVPVPAALAEFLGEEPSSAALRGGPMRAEIDQSHGHDPSPPESPESSRAFNFDDRPPTPSPEDAAEMDVARPPRPLAALAPVQILPVPSVPVEPEEAPGAPPPPPQPAPQPAVSSGCQMPHAASFEHVSSKLSPAEATRIAALRAKGLLKPDVPVTEVPQSVPPPKPEGFEDQDLFYIEGGAQNAFNVGWCDIYGRTADSLARGTSPAKSSRSVRSQQSSSSSPTRSGRWVGPGRGGEVGSYRQVVTGR
eukprot:Skav212551  [mRNA]  locus=scaffold1851:695127:698727:- [translate_table: standard]